VTSDKLEQCLGFLQQGLPIPGRFGGVRISNQGLPLAGGYFPSCDCGGLRLLEKKKKKKNRQCRPIGAQGRLGLRPRSGIVIGLVR